MAAKDRIDALRVKYRHTRIEMARILQTPPSTYDKWFYRQAAAPPACMLLLLDILEQSAEARGIAGLEPIIQAGDDGGIVLTSEGECQDCDFNSSPADGQRHT